MTCPKPEVLSQWADGSLDPRESLVVGRHAETCAACRAKAGELRAVGAWIRSAAQPGASCLTADDMAAVLEGGRVPAHVRTCPRCASEFRALRQTERKATRRRQKPPAPMTAWAAAAAIFIAVGLLLVIANQQTSKTEDVAFRPPSKPPVVEPRVEPTPPAPQVTKPEPVVPPKPPAIERKPEPATAQKPVERHEVPEPKPVVKETPAPEAPKTPVRPTEVVEAPKAPPALTVRAGGLSSLSDGRWVKATKIEEGMALRADGKTQLDFAQARITLDGASRFSVAKDEFSLNDGGMSAEVPAGSKLVLVLEDTRLVPYTVQSRVIFCARADRIVVEEGAMKAKDAFLQEGVEHLVKKDGIKAQARRTMAAAARSRETVAWKMNLQNEVTVKNNINGRIERGAETKTLISVPTGGAFFYGQASYFSTGDEPPLFVAKPNTAVRFRYYVTQSGPLEFVMKNLTKDENFNRTIDPVLKQWTTVTLFARDVLANTGGKKVFYETGDVYRGVTWFIGKPGVPTEVYIDRLEILEIDR